MPHDHSRSSTDTVLTDFGRITFAPKVIAYLDRHAPDRHAVDSHDAPASLSPEEAARQAAVLQRVRDAHVVFGSIGLLADEDEFVIVGVGTFQIRNHAYFAYDLEQAERLKEEAEAAHGGEFAIFRREVKSGDRLGRDTPPGQPPQSALAELAEVLCSSDDGERAARYEHLVGDLRWLGGLPLDSMTARQFNAAVISRMEKVAAGRDAYHARVREALQRALNTTGGTVPDLDRSALSLANTLDDMREAGEL